jgi:hypothetical protein
MTNLQSLVLVGVLLVIFLLASGACKRELLRNERDERPHPKQADDSSHVKKAA